MVGARRRQRSRRRSADHQRCAVGARRAPPPARRPRPDRRRRGTRVVDRHPSISRPRRLECARRRRDRRHRTSVGHRARSSSGRRARADGRTRRAGHRCRMAGPHRPVVRLHRAGRCVARLELVDGLHVPLVAPRSGRPCHCCLRGRTMPASSSDDYHAPLRLNGAAMAEPMADLAELARAQPLLFEQGDLAGVACRVGRRLAHSPTMRAATRRSRRARRAGACRRACGHHAWLGRSSRGGVPRRRCNERAIAAVQRAGCEFVRFDVS